MGRGLALYKQSADNYRPMTRTVSIACRPDRKPASRWGAGYPVKIVQTPKLTVFLYEYQTIFRQVFIDGRGLPADPLKIRRGWVIRWDVGTETRLIVTTAGYNDRTSLDLGGHPHSESLRLTERFHRRDFGHIDLEVTVEDPKAYKHAWTLPRRSGSGYRWGI